MKTIELEAGTIDYQDTGGDGPVIVLLHGLRMDAGAVAAQWMGVGAGRQQRGDLDPQGFRDRRWQGRHETSR